jgi:hypothetical protein
MPTAPTNVQFWSVGLTAANALVPAIVALTTTWLVHFFTERREVRKENAAAAAARRRLKREKLENLVVMVYDHYERCRKEGQRVAMQGIQFSFGLPAPDDTGESGPDSYERASMFQELYFQQLAPQMAALNAATLGHSQFLSAEIEAFTVNAQNWNTHQRPTFAARHTAALTPLYQARQAIADRARELLNEMAVS